MNKVITIHLNGKSYQIEEMGFDALRAYLAEAERHLAENPDKSEIIKDLEQAIGEKCLRYLSAHKDVVTTTEVEKILAEMGPVSGEEQPKNDSGAQSNGKSDWAHKRLYLIREGAVIGGVCTGIAAYLGVDVTIVRLIFVALTIGTGGGFILAYIAAMILIPYANTSEEKAAAHGLPFNAQELVNKARAQYREFAAGAQWRTTRVSQWHADHLAWKNSRRMWKEQMRAQKAAARAARSPAFGAISTLIGVVWIIALLGIITSGTIFGFPIPSNIPLWVAIVILFVLFHAVTGPLQSGRGSGYNDPWFALVDGMGIFFVAIAFAFAYVHYPAVQEFVQSIPQRLADLYYRITN